MISKSKLQLISHDLCPYVQRAIITLLEKGIPHERTYIDLAHKPDWFLQISPLGKVPLLKVDSEVLFESAVICEYLDEVTPDSLHPPDPLIKAKHRAWIEYGSSILNSIAGFYNAPNIEDFRQKKAELISKFEWVEKSLLADPYFAGEPFYLVDVAFAPIFRYFDQFERIPNFDCFVNTPKVKRWRSHLQARPSIQKAVVEDYPQRLHDFLLRRNSYLSTLI